MKKLIAIVVTVLCTACSAQKTEPRKVFDIEVFHKNKVNNEYNFILEDGTTVRQIEWKDEYDEIRYNNKSYFEIYTSYYKNGNLKMFVERFPNRFVKYIKEYDEEGNLIKETDYDKEFEFTWEQLLKILEERNVDIRDVNNTTIRKQNGNWRFDYIQDIYIYDVIIHGKTGKVLQDAKNVFQEGS